MTPVASEMLFGPWLSLQQFVVMFRLNGFFKSAFQPSVRGQQGTLGGNFNAVDKGFDPQFLVGILTGDRIAVGFKLNHGKTIRFHGYNSATFR